MALQRESKAVLCAEATSVLLPISTHSVTQVWERLNGGNNSKEEELMALQRESKALLSLRAEATKLRAGFQLVERQKELKRKSLIRYNAEAVLDEMLRADRSIMRLQKELSLKVKGGGRGGNGASGSGG
jgi:molecular chaperone GrpE (heat shock protein)